MQVNDSTFGDEAKMAQKTTWMRESDCTRLFEYVLRARARVCVLLFESSMTHIPLRFSGLLEDADGVRQPPPIRE